MSELTLLVLQLGFLLVLWLFIFAIVYALRSDLFGQRVRRISSDSSSSSPSASSFPSSPVTPGRGAPQAEPKREPTQPEGDATAENANRLVITSGPKSGSEFPLGRDEVTIGRSSDSAIIIRDDYTSTHHARLMLWNGTWMVQDLDSTNGTFLNGARVTVPTTIPLGGAVKVGATTFELRR